MMNDAAPRIFQLVSAGRTIAMAEAPRSLGPAPSNPSLQALFQSQPSSEQDWHGMLDRVLALNKHGDFGSQPQANRFGAILEAVVPPPPDPTHEKVLAIVNALLETQAIRRDEAGQMYSALLQRVSRYNSINVQGNLDRLIQDVKEALAQRERVGPGGGLGSVIALNAFLSTQPAVVERGQDDYVAFISALKLMVTEAPQSEVYQSGPSFFIFQTNRHGSQTVNLSQAFDNLRPLWGVRAPINERTTISSLLTPNSRLLLLLIAPFTDSVGISRDSYLGHLLMLYRETIGNTRVNETTYNEITEVSRALGAEDASNLQATLNYLLTNKQTKLPQDFSLTAEEERVLRYIQQAVSLFLMQDGQTATTALDQASANIAPSFYAAHRDFINRLMDYFQRAAAMAPDYFLQAVLNPHWLPPPGFFTQEFDFPEPNEGFLWDDMDSALAAVPVKEESLAPSPPFSAPPSRTLSPSPASMGAAAAAEPANMFASSVRNVQNNGIDELIDRMNRWKTYAQEKQEIRDMEERRRRRDARRRARRERRASSEDDDSDLGPFLRGRGCGPVNRDPFGHLRPRGPRQLL
ncbi:IIIA [Deer mastadenovirus B]|uniref:Pre-hexon-linking protein IIIa n=1 Tax=Deer mastadenovirus B TaxID=2170000 RepID=A0A1Y0B6F9_9ADEN|nr:IIIA [Deer mastadenovirus B]ART33366.1 IIIA [Deer mastadenovirus B]